MGSESKAQREAYRAELYRKLDENGNARIRWFDQFKTFRMDAGTLIGEINLFTSHPGWPDMGQLIKAAASIRYVEGEDAAERKTEASMAEWSRKWAASGEDVFTRYLALVERSRRSENRRVVLLQEWDQFYRETTALEWRLVVSYLQERDGHVTAEALQGTIKIEESLYLEQRSTVNSYGIGSLGLYERHAK
jgi:hypothetical protein